MKEREYIGWKDKNGNKIHTGDVVEFYFDADTGHNCKRDLEHRMRDLVEKIDGKFYFTCCAGGAFPFRHNEHCEIIGTDKSLIDT